MSTSPDTHLSGDPAPSPRSGPRRKLRRRPIVWVGTILALLLLIVGGVVWKLSSVQNEVFPRLPNRPEVGTWYGVYPDGARSALGGPYHGIFRLGTSNNVMVLFNGGGVSVNAETAVGKDHQYFNTSTGGDVLARLSLGSEIKKNPFADWTIINLPYTTGDFHSGAGDFTFDKPDGGQGTLHHVGYKNFDLVMLAVRPLIGKPDKLLVAGYSAGGFATALMSDHVMSYFPDTNDVTVAVDSALLLNNKWRAIATDVWHTPTAIANRLTSDDITLDSLTALAADHPHVKILFSSSTRDESLVEVQAYFDTGVLAKTAAGGDAYTHRLRTFVGQLRHVSPNVAFYIFQGPTQDNGLTMHTMLLLTSFSEDLGPVTPAQWINNAVNGTLEDHGLDLLR